MPFSSPRVDDYRSEMSLKLQVMQQTILLWENTAPPGLEPSLDQIKGSTFDCSRPLPSLPLCQSPCGVNANRLPDHNKAPEVL